MCTRVHFSSFFLITCTTSDFFFSRFRHVAHWSAVISGNVPAVLHRFSAWFHPLIFIRLLVFPQSKLATQHGYNLLWKKHQSFWLDLSFAWILNRKLVNIINTLSIPTLQNISVHPCLMFNIASLTKNPHFGHLSSIPAATKQHFLSNPVFTR